MANSVTFAGTYTQNRGEAVAAGTVAITPYQGSTTTVTLDSTGSYSTTIATAGLFTVVETITGVPVRTFTVRAIDGAAVDTSRDVGEISGGSSGSIGSISGLTAALAAKQDAFSPGTYVGNAERAATLDSILVGTITRDTNGAATSAPAVWPDGATGTYTALVVSSSFPGAVDSYSVTHVLGGTTITYTQPTVTRDATTGAVTVRPALVVS